MVNSLLEKRKGKITRERHTVNGLEQSIIYCVLMSSDNYNNKEALKMFKHETNKSDQLSKLIDMNRPIDIVMKKFIK